DRTTNAERVEQLGMELAEIPEHGRAEPQHAAAARMEPGRWVARNLDVVDRRACGGERGERIFLGGKQIGLARPVAPVGRAWLPGTQPGGDIVLPCRRIVAVQRPQ